MDTLTSEAPTPAATTIELPTPEDVGQVIGVPGQPQDAGELRAVDADVRHVCHLLLWFP